jgi:signal transduction histidine kinase
LTYIGGEQRRRDEQRTVVSELTGRIRVEQGFGESLRQALGVVARVFDVERCLLSFYDRDADRLYLWNLHEESPDQFRLEQRPTEQRDWFFLNKLETSFYWNGIGQSGVEGAGWREGRKIESSQVPAAHPEFVKQFRARSVLAVSFTFGSVPAGRILLINRQGEFSVAHLRLLELILRRVGPTLENLFLLRHLRARTVESERTRIARDLHDGVLQTLVSVEMQLDVCRRQATRNPDRIRRDLNHLQELVRKETLDLRQFVSDLKPIQVESEDLMDLVREMAERYERENGIHVDVLGEAPARNLPVRVCREIFQIIREGLNNIKKHSGASHVVVKLSEEDNHISLMIDDNGKGFTFAGRLSSEELDQLRLGPISIKERTRTIGGRLMIESTPGHGARLTVEVPVN